MRPLLLLLALVTAGHSARILAFFPMIARSHQFVFRPILEELAKRGHEVLYVTGAGYDQVPKGIRQIDLGRYIPKPSVDENQKFSWLEFGEASIPTSVITLYEMFIMMAPHILGNAEVQRLVHSDERFDAVMLESYFSQEYISPLIHKFGAVGIEVMPLGDCAWVNELSGLPDNPTFQLDYKNAHTNSLGFLSRLYNCYVVLTTTLLGYYYLSRHQAISDTYLNYTGWESRPPLGQLVSNRSLILTNYHFSVGYPAPRAPHKVDIGGIHIKPSKPLPKDLQKYMDDSKNGVIYLSLGSNVNVSDVATEQIREAFMRAFEELPQNVLMKWETDYPGKVPPNVRLSKWFPQQDILAHKNCVLFVTHGGYLSITEAVHFGVPLVGIPIFGDQAKNMIIAKEAGYGKELKFRDISKETVSRAIKEVLSNKRYKEEAVRRSKLFRDRLHTPVEEAAFWVEYSIRYPNALTPKGAMLSFVQLHLLDIWLFVATVVLSVLWALCAILRGLGKLCRSTAKKDPKKKVKKS